MTINILLEYLRRIVEPHEKNEDRNRQQLILNIILVASISLLILLTSTVIGHMIITGNHYQGVHLGWFLVILAAHFFLFTLSKKGYSRTASHILIAIYTTGAIYSGYIWGPSLPITLLVFCLIIVTSSVLIGSRYGVLVTALTILIIISLGIHEISGLASTSWKSKLLTRGDIVAYSGIILFITTIFILSNKEIEKSLNRARKSEKELQYEKDNLEIKVEERTKELKQAQIENMNELYRSAEFGKLAQGIFHDLINPLTSVSLNVEQLTRPNTSPSDIKIYIDRAVGVTKKMSAFVSSVRKQIQSHNIKEDFSIGKEINDVIDVLKYKARMSNVKIIFDQTNDIRTYGNPLKIHQIFSNLISNAIDAFALSSQKNKTVVIAVEESLGVIELYVSDNAGGIDPKILPHIFDPFFTTKSRDKGSGIGLAIVKHIIEKDFCGSISVTSNLEETRFTFKLKK